MSSQLKILISLLEEEKARLEKLIKEYLSESEYQMAHYHSNALAQIGSRLQTLHNIEDNLYDDKQWIQRRITILENEIETGDKDYMKEFYSKQLLKEKAALEKLNQTPNNRLLSDAPSLFDNVLDRLVDKKVKNLKLILKKADNFFLTFSYSKRILKVTLPYVKQHLKNFTLYDESMQTLTNLGFDLTKNGSRLILSITGDKQHILYKLKIILSKIVFEIFYFKEFENESYIQFME